MQGRDALSEPRLPCAPHLRNELAIDSLRVVVDVGHVLDGVLHLDQQFSRRSGGTGRHLLRGRQQQIIVIAAVHQADPFGLGAIHHFPEHDTSKRGLRTDNATQHPGVAAARMDADLKKTRVELGATGGQPHIATECEVHACTNSGTVDCGQSRQRTAGDTQEPLINAPETFLRGLGKVAKIGACTECRSGAGDHQRADCGVGFDLVHSGDDLGHHWRGQRVAFGRIVERERGDTVGHIDKYERHRNNRTHARRAARYRRIRMLDHVFTDAISALRDAFESAFLERQPFEEHFQSDILLGDLTWETSYGLPGEGLPPHVVAHITFDWPSWSQTAYRQWYVDEVLERQPAIEIEIVFRVQNLLDAPQSQRFYGATEELSPLIGDGRLERAGVTVETAFAEETREIPEYAVEVTYEGLYELAEITLADGANTLLDDHLGVLGGWIATTLVRLADLR